MRNVTRNDILTVVIVFVLVMLALLLFTRYAGASDGTPELLTISASVDGLTVTVSGTYTNADGVRIYAQPGISDYDWQHYTCQSYYAPEFSCSFVLAGDGYRGRFYITEIGLIRDWFYDPVSVYEFHVDDDDGDFYWIENTQTNIPVAFVRFDGLTPTPTPTPTETPTPTATPTATPTETPTATVGAFVTGSEFELYFPNVLRGQ